jgi:hypothetical protein
MGRKIWTNGNTSPGPGLPHAPSAAYTRRALPIDGVSPSRLLPGRVITTGDEFQTSPASTVPTPTPMTHASVFTVAAGNATASPAYGIDALVPNCRGQQAESSFRRYFVAIREGYCRSPGYSFLDMHATSSSQHTEVARWRLLFVFASELDRASDLSLARLLTHYLFLFPSPLFSCDIYTQPVVSSNRAPDMLDRQRTTFKICPLACDVG